MNVTQPLTDRLDRLTPAGRIAWHADQAAADFQRHLLDSAVAAVSVAASAVEAKVAA